jgi:hypothetical protein
VVNAGAGELKISRRFELLEEEFCVDREGATSQIGFPIHSSKVYSPQVKIGMPGPPLQGVSQETSQPQRKEQVPAALAWLVPETIRVTKARMGSQVR